MLLIYSEHITARLCYTLDLIFKELSGIEYQLTTNVSELKEFDGPVLVYSSESEGSHPRIWSSGFLFEQEIRNFYPGIVLSERVPALFPAPVAFSGLKYDALSAIFYMVSRYEEYTNPVRDAFGRFPAAESVAYKNGFLEKAVVHLWTFEIIGLIQKHYPELKAKSNQYTFLPTIDIDIAFKYKYRGLIRTLGGTFRSLIHGDFRSVTERFAVILNFKKDPFDTFEELENLHTQFAENARYFFLLADYGGFDKGLPPANPGFRKFIASFSQNGQCGIHPSFRSNLEISVLEKELQLFQTMTGSPCRSSRQHYLKLSLPETYQNLILMGIKEDYSMGFADLPGFRAGLAAPFHFFDLTKNQKEDLKIWPITFMDGTLRDYMKLSDPESLEYACKLCDHVRSVDGTMISLFHNETISHTGRFRNWNSLYSKFLSYATSLTQ